MVLLNKAILKVTGTDFFESAAEWTVRVIRSPEISI